MANRTDPLARSVHGTNPQFLIGKIVRNKVYDSAYWKENCFGLTAASIIDKATELTHVGGTYGGSRKATPFLCLVVKLLQIQPATEIVLEYIRNEDFKYLRILGAFYLRLTGSSLNIYKCLEPLLADYSKLRYRKSDGKVYITHMDEMVDAMLRESTVFEIDLPCLPDRRIVEETYDLSPYVSPLEEELAFEETVQTKLKQASSRTSSTGIRDSDQEFRRGSRNQDTRRHGDEQLRSRRHCS